MTEALTRENVKVMDKTFIGPEFLTWLYFSIVNENAPASLEGWVDPLAFAIGKKVALKATDGSGTKVSLAGALDDNGELLQAIRRGAMFESLELELAIGSRPYRFTLLSDGTLQGVKLPDLFTEPEEGTTEGVTVKKKLPLEDVFALRMQCLDHLEAVIDSVFSLFVQVRLSSDWEELEVAEIRQTVSTGLRARLVGVAQ